MFIANVAIVVLAMIAVIAAFAFIVVGIIVNAMIAEIDVDIKKFIKLFDQ